MNPEPSQELSRDRHTVLLVTAAWCIPCRPAPTLLRELARRWSGDVHPVLLEDPSDAQLDEWGISVLPTWLRLEPAAEPADTRSVEPADALDDALTDEPADTPADPPGEGRPGARISTQGTYGIRDSHDSHDTHGTHDTHDTHGIRDSHDIHRTHDIHDTHGLIVRDIPARAPDGAAVHLPGVWVIADRVEGALPKHVIHDRLGPDSVRPDGDSSRA